MQRRRHGLTLLLVLVGMELVGPNPTRGDDVVLKNGLTIRGTVEKDNALRMVSDDLKRVFLRDSKIASTSPSSPYSNLERFLIVQPLEVHAGAMPGYAIDVKTGPWSEKGRRSFSYVGPRSSKPVVMTQAINDLGPYMVRFRGVDGFWVSQVVTSQVPKPIILGLLGRVDRKLLNERQRVARFMLQAGWYDDAKKEVESIARDFPEERDRSKGVIQAIQELDAREKRRVIFQRLKAQQPVEVRRLLKEFPTENVPTDVELEIKDLRKKLSDEDTSNRKLADLFRDSVKAALPAPTRSDEPKPIDPKLADPSAKKTEVKEPTSTDPSGGAQAKKPPARVVSWKELAVNEILKQLAEAPDAVGSRLEPFAKADPKAPAEAKLALAVSGWIAGPESATTDLATAEVLFQARDHIKTYLTHKEEPARKIAIDALHLLESNAASARSGGPSTFDLEVLTRMIPLMVPPFAPEVPGAGKVMTHRVMFDDNPEPTEYMIYLPPEYHPLRNYPTVVALHDGNGPRRAIDWWIEEAGKHGFIVIAPEYFVSNQPKIYHYSTSEHAAIELSLRDARKRYSVDSNRVFLAGSMLGGNVALDIGFAHPDLFAGVATVSGLPAKFSFPYRKNVDNIPLYIALGDLAPGAKDVVFETFVKPMIIDSQDILYTEYIHRGHEDIPEEASTLIEWMEKYKRDPYRKTFEAYTARPSDARFWGVVVQELSAGRSIAPEAADALGKNIRSAKVTARASALSNLLNINASGVDRLDVWISPKVLDFKKKLEVRINGRTYFKALAKPDFNPILTDLRYRGDRQQLYWLKISAGR